MKRLIVFPLPVAAVFLSLLALGCKGGGGGEDGFGGTDFVPFCESDAECAAASTSECSLSTCDLVDGVCVSTPLPDGRPCDDNAGVCRAGFCAQTELKAYVKSPSPEPDALFGTSVSLRGDRMIVGAPSTTLGSGTVAVFERSAEQWSVIEQIDTPPVGRGCGDGLFGWAVAASDETFSVASLGTAIGGAGSVRVFIKLPDGWREQPTGGCLRGADTQGLDLFGVSLAMRSAGDALVVGAPGHSTGELPIPVHMRDYAGAAYIFERVNAADWVEAPILLASNGGGSYECELCDDLACPTSGEGDGFGVAVGIWEDTVVVGAPGEASADTGTNGDESDNSAPGAGAAYVFERIDDEWQQTAYLKASNTDEGDRFGFAVAVHGDTIVVGAEREDGGDTANQGDNSAIDAGAVYIFERMGGVWEQTQYLKASNVDAGFFFGSNLTVSDTTLVVGSPGESSIGGEDSGAAYVFTLDDGAWAQTNFYKAFNADAGSAFAGPPGSVAYGLPSSLISCETQSTTTGASLTLSGDTVVVGTPYEDSAAIGVNGTPTNNAIPNSGAVYIFDNSEGQ